MGHPRIMGHPGQHVNRYLRPGTMVDVSSQVEAIYNTVARVESLQLSLVDGLLVDRSKYVDEFTNDLTGNALTLLTITNTYKNPFLLQSVQVSFDVTGTPNVALQLGMKKIPIFTATMELPQNWNLILDPNDVRQLTATGTGTFKNASLLLTGTQIPTRGTMK